MRGPSLDRKVKTDDEESGSSALTMRAPPVQIDKAFLEGEAQEVRGLEGLAGITGKQPVKLNLEGALKAEAAREKFIEFCASELPLAHITAVGNPETDSLEKSLNLGVLD